MPRGNKHRKTRRHLKARGRRITRRLRLQHGGATPTNIDEWVRNARDKFAQLSATGITVLGDLKDDDLKLPSTIELGSEDNMKLTYTQADVEIMEDIRDVARLIYISLTTIVGQENLESITPAVFKKTLAEYPNNPERIGDDTVSTALEYLLACENGLRRLAAIDMLAPIEAPIDALNSSTDPLFIWALAVNNAKQPEAPSLFDEAVLKKNISEPT